MNATELKTKIRAHLDAFGETTAKQITKAIGHDDYPTEVIKALSEMRTDAEVECEKKSGKGNEYWYWMVNASAAAGKAIDVPVIPKAKAAPAKTPESSPVEQQVSQGLDMYNLRQQLKDTEKVCEAHFASLQTATTRIDELNDDVRRQVQRATAAEQNRDDLKNQVDELFLRLNQAQETIATLETAVDMAQQTIHTMELEAEQTKDVKDAAVGYLVRVPGKPSKVRTKPESAHAAALSGARAHGRAEVLALVPVGKAVRGAEWHEAEAA